jgi:hypothetical protein
MKEIDFLPEWYKSGQRRQLSYRTQYIALGGIFLVMLSWNLISSRSISKAAAELKKFDSEQKEAEQAMDDYKRIKSEIEKLQNKAGVLEQMDSRIDVASVLAELSYLLEQRIALSKVEFTAEKLEDKRQVQNVGIVPVGARQALKDKSGLLLGDVRFKITINGVAADGSDVAGLICRLEDSPYFCRVIPSFSRNTQIKTAEGPAQEQLQVTEFEIGCLLANYVESE